MLSLDEILEEYNVDFDELNPEEKETIFGWIENYSKAEITPDRILIYIQTMRASVEAELVKVERSKGWLSLLSVLIPVVGLMRKWYDDQHKLALEARLKNYILFEQVLTAPEKIKQSIEDTIKNSNKVDNK